MRKKRARKAKRFTIVFIFIFIVGVVFVFVQYKNNVLPSVLEISEKYAVNAINEKINFAVEKVIGEMNLTSKDFFEKDFDDDERVNYFSVDTILINKVCSKIAEEISNEVKNSESEKIELPVGIFSGLDLISNFGPKFSISVLHAGATTADYETAFESSGINQVNFKIWLVTTTDVSVVNPFYDKKISVKRKLMLVNTVFNGKVPSTYLNFSDSSLKQNFENFEKP